MKNLQNHSCEENVSIYGDERRYIYLIHPNTFRMKFPPECYLNENPRIEPDLDLNRLTFEYFIVNNYKEYYNKYINENITNGEKFMKVCKDMFYSIIKKVQNSEINLEVTKSISFKSESIENSILNKFAFSFRNVFSYYVYKKERLLTIEEFEN